MTHKMLLASALIAGCSDYSFKEADANRPGSPDTDRSEDESDPDPEPVTDTGGPEPEPDTGNPDTGEPEPEPDTGCSIDLETWDLNPRWERSAMADRVQTNTIGTCLTETVALATSPYGVWDTGTYTPESLTEEGLSAGRQWASWDQEGEVDCHRLTLTVDLPECDWSALQLSSPWFDGVPINDNLYVLVEGTTVWTGGTSFGIVNGGGPHETGGWIESQISDLSIDVLGTGERTIDFVVEEREEWGGLGFIVPTLIP